MSFRASQSMTYIAGADLSAKKNTFVKLSDEKTVVACGAGEKGIGVLMNEPKSGEMAEIAAFGGGAKIKASAALALMVSVASDANGKATAAGAGDFVFGFLTEASGADGDIVAMELFPSVKDA